MENFDKPIVNFSVDRTTIIEGGEPQLLTFNLNQPAPAGGLVVNLRVDDPDGDEGAGDTNFPPELISNITGFGQVEEDGVTIASVTIAEGATVATFGVAAFEDDLVEIGETYSFTLLEDDNYIVAPDSSTITTTIEDAISLPTVGITPEVVTAIEGETFAWNFSLDQPAPVGGLSLFLPITDNSDLAAGDVEYFVEGSSNISDFEFVTTDESISQIYAFGDSYSDDGLSFELSTEAVEAGVPGSFILPADPELGLYDPEGRWTNGLTAVEVLSDTLDVELTDYAVGGAKSGNGNYYSWLDSVQDTGVFGQIDQFSTELSGEVADPDALYFIFASANDLFEFTDFGLPGTVEELATQTVENIVEGVTDLSELGAEQFLVVNSSDLDILPGIIEFGQVEEATVFTDEVNELLPEALAAASQELGVEIALYDHVAISDEIRSNPQDFGLTNVDDPFQPVFPVEPTPTDAEPDEYYFWDEYHPTARTHEIIGEDMASFVGSEFEDDDVSVGFNVTIAEGATEATLVSEAIVDDIEEGNESFTIVIAEDENYNVNPDQNQVVTNLLDSGDSSTMTTVSILPEILIATEGDSLVRNITLDQPVPEGGLTLNLVVAQSTESPDGDLIINLEASSGITDFNGLVVDDVTLGVTLTLAEGITEALLVADTLADDILETDEISSLSLADGENYRANPEQNNIFTVLTDRTVVTLTTDEVNVTEGETFAWNFSLNRPAPEGGLTLSLPITLNNDPEPGDVIYNVEGSTNIEDFGFITQDDVSVGFTLTIPEGETEATLVSQAVVDDIAEFDEIFTTVLADGNEYVANPVSNQVVTTIAEDGVAPPSFVPVVSITPEILISTEGDTFAWDITLDQPVPEGGLTLNLPITQNNDPEPGDVIYNVEGSTGITDFDFIVEDNISIGFSVTLEEGVTSATVVSEAVADDNDIEEAADEIFTTVLADGVDYRANPDSNEVVTVLTRETVVSFTPEQVNVAEGETFAWNFSLNQPAPEGGLDLLLPITFNNDPEPGDVDYNVEGSTNITDFSFLVIDNVSVGFSVTIAEGETEATLVSQAVADDLEEIDEIFTTILADGGNYRANPVSREVVTTIFEQDSSSTPVISVTAEPTIFAENGGMGSFIITLSEPAPEEGLEIKFEAVDEDGMQGDSEVALENISDIEIITDGSNSSFLIVEPGATEAKLMFTGIPDGVPEGEELSAFTILEGEGYTIDSNQSSANIIITDLPIVSVFAEPTEVEEGSQLFWNFSLTEAVPAGGLAVDLDLVEDTDPLPGDITYFVEGSENITDFDLVIDESTGLIDKAVVTLAEGATSATLVSDIIADNATEGPESVSFALAEVEGYSIDSDVNAASFTILDTSVATGDETIVGDESDEVLDGLDGDDLIAGGFGNDEILGGDGADVLRGDLNSRSPGGTVGGDDTIFGGAGDDRIGGKAGDDELFGDEGNDAIWGDDGDDLIRGGLGDDTLIGDDFSGGSGVDTFVLAAGEGTDTIVDFEVGTDIIGLADGLMAEDLTFTASSGSTAIALGDETLATLEGVVVTADEVDYLLF